MWDKLIQGDKDYPECGELWDEWNTVILPELRRKAAKKKTAKVKKIIEKNDKNGDGVLDERDY